MNNAYGIINSAVSGDGIVKFFVGSGTAFSGSTGAINKKLEAVCFKHPLTSVISTLELPVKKFRETGRKFNHINAGTYS